MPVFQCLATQPMKPLRTPFLAECFCVLRSLYQFVLINELFSFLFQSSFDVFRSAATETGDPIDTTQQAAWTQRMQTQRCPHSYFSPALSASTA